MTSAGIDPTISEGERPQFYALHSAATGTGACSSYCEALQSSLMSGRVVSVVTEHRG